MFSDLDCKTKGLAFHRRLTGTAAEAMIADQITQSGLVRYYRKQPAQHKKYVRIVCEIIMDALIYI